MPIHSLFLSSLTLLACFASASHTAIAAPKIIVAPKMLPSGFKEARQTIGDGTKLHYIRGGTGEPILLIHGFTETSRMWRPLLPALGKNYTVIAPDLPGLGGSSILPDGDYAMKTVARNLHELVQKLGFTRIRVVGHDIGMMAAYAYAARYPQEVQKLVLMDAPLPGIGATWEKVFTDPALWHFHFVESPIALKLVQGRERTFLDHFWISFSGEPAAVAIPEEDRQAYALLYAQKGSMQAGFAYFRGFPRDAKDNKQFQRAGKLPMPILVLEGERAMGGALTAQANQVASSVHSVILKGAGHWLMEERPQEVQFELIAFLKD